MRISLLIFVQLLGFQAALLAQTLLYPIRKDHNWGFISRTGRVILPPTFDVLTETPLPWNDGGKSANPSPFRLVEDEARAGLIDINLRQVLPCKFGRIRPLAADVFMVEKDSFFAVIDGQEREFFPERYEDIRVADTLHARTPPFFLVKKKGKWGAVDTQGKPIIPAEYAEIDAAGGTGFFKVKTANGNGKWLLRDQRNQALLSGREYPNMEVLSTNFIAVNASDPGSKSKHWWVVDAHGEFIFKNQDDDPIEFSHVQLLNNHWVALERRGDENFRAILWNLKTDKRHDAGKRIFAFFPFDEQHILTKGRFFGMLDTAGKFVLQPEFDSIKTSGLPGILRLRRDGSWGLWRQGVQPIGSVNFTFQRLENFSDSVALCFDNLLGWGAVNVQGREIVPRMYREIVRDGDELKAFDSRGKLKIFKLKNADASLEQSFDNEVLTLKIGPKGNVFYKEAEILKPRPFGIKPLEEPEKFPNLLVSRDSTLAWRRDLQTELWGLTFWPEKPGAQQPANVPIFAVKRVASGQIHAVYSSGRVTNRFVREMFSKETRLAAQALHDFSKNGLLTGFRFFGLRVGDFDAGSPVAAFLDTSGLMGLMRRDGEILKNENGKPLFFTYLGKFSLGKAPVCVGGALRSTTEYELGKFKILTPYELVSEFRIEQPPGEQTSIFTPGKFIFIDTSTAAKPRWGYVDTLGRFFLEPQYDRTFEYQTDSCALVKRGEFFGLLDSAGRELLPCQFRSIERFHDHFRVSVRNPNLYYFNQKGNQVCEPVYDKYKGFVGDFGVVRRGGRFGFINAEGREVIECRFDSVQFFSENMALVRDSGQWVFIDTAGRAVFFPEKNAGAKVFAGGFHDGRCRFRKGKTWGFFDKNGSVRIEPRFESASDFSKKRAVVKQGKFFGVLDTAGKWVVEPTRFEEMTPFNDWGVSVVRENARGFFGLLDTSGRLLTPLQFHKIGAFAEGFAPVLLNGVWGLISASGKVVIAPQFAEIQGVSENAVAAKTREKKDWIYLNTEGKRMMSANFYAAEPFKNSHALVNGDRIINRYGTTVPLPKGQLLFYSEGIAGIKTGDNAWFADPLGNNLFGRFFEDVKPFESGLAKIQQRRKWGALNRRGCFVVPVKYNFVHQQPDGNIIVRPPALYGLFDKGGKQVIEPIFDRLEMLEGNVFRVEIGEKVGYFRQSGKVMWPLGN